MALIRTTRSPGGIALGEQLSRFYEQELSKRPHELDDRCSTCAFRLGTLPNGAATTLMDVVKCIHEQVDFNCHEKGREGKLCHGYKLMQAKPGETPRKMPWNFSDEPENQA